MRGRLVSRAASVVLAFAVIGCHSMHFEVGEGPVGRKVHDRKSFFLGGLVPTREVDVSEHCPNGAVAVSEETTFVDGLLNVLTLSIYSPRSSTYHCAVEGQ